MSSVRTRPSTTHRAKLAAAAAAAARAADLDEKEEEAIAETGVEDEDA